MLDSSLVVWGAVLTGGRELPPSVIEVRAGRITRIEPGARPANADVAVSADHGWIAPGLVDLQVNGAGGIDLTSATDASAALERVAHTLAEHGITAFCPTLVSSPAGLILDRLPAFGPRGVSGGAESLGAHVEGPFINAEHRGVHDPRMIRPVSVAEVGGWLAVGAPTIVTLAPECAQTAGFEVIRQLTEVGVVVSLGHSGADAPAAQAALAAGATMGTHVFNAMPPFHHRHPGLVGALLASSAFLGLIVDGVHLDPLAVDLVVRRAGTGRVALVSDALAAAGAPPGPSVLGDQAVESDGRAVRRTDGTLAGSALLLDGCLRHARACLPWLSPAEVLQMATQTPADAVRAQKKGRIEVGADADLIVLDRDWNVRHTIVGGQPLQPTRSPVEVRP